jgi:vesicle-associated membrane protein 7
MICIVCVCVCSCSHIFHYLVDDGITFLCMSDEGMKRRITFSFLDEIKKIFRENYQGVERTALAFSLNESFAPVLRQQIVSTIM